MHRLTNADYIKINMFTKEANIMKTVTHEAKAGQPATKPPTFFKSGRPSDNPSQQRQSPKKSLLEMITLGLLSRDGHDLPLSSKSEVGNEQLNLPKELTQPLPAEMQTAILNRPVISPLTLDDKQLSQSSIEKILKTQQKLNEIKHSLSVLIDSVAAHPSYFSAWSKAWGDTAIWKKWLGGTLVTGLPLTVALTVHIPVLLALSGIVAVGYGAAGFLLDDHHRSMNIYLQKIKEGVLSLADILAWTITSLEEIANQLAEEVSKFKAENSKLKSENHRLSENVNRLCQGVDLMIENIRIKMAEREQLSSLKLALEEHLNSLKASDERQRLQGEKQLSVLDETYNLISDELAKQVATLNTEKTELIREVSKLRTIGETLQSTVTTLSASCIQDESKRLAFQTQLEKFLSDKEGSFAELTAKANETSKKLSTTQDALAKTQKELEQTKRELQSVLNDQHQVLTRLECLEQQKAKHFESFADSQTVRIDKVGEEENILIEHGIGL